MVIHLNKKALENTQMHLLNLFEDDIPQPGRWYNAGKLRTCKMLEDIGYIIINTDLEIDYRNPIIYFKK